MGIYDRDYTHDNYDRGGPGMRLMLPSMTPGVKWLLIINVAVFVPAYLIPELDNFLTVWFSVYPSTLLRVLQPWRLISYQFLHAGVMHILFNMLVLYFFGPLLERLWGMRKFVIFYLTCGAMGGLVYPLLVLSNVLPALPLIGASGAIFGMLAAGAVLFPGLRVFFMGIFPMSLRTLAILLAVLSLLKFAGDHNRGGEAAHLAGMAAGFAYVFGRPWAHARVLESKKGAWAKKMEHEQQFQAEVDRILDKVHASGVNSLTRREKTILREATQREQQQGR